MLTTAAHSLTQSISSFGWLRWSDMPLSPSSTHREQLSLNESAKEDQSDSSRYGEPDSVDRWKGKKRRSKIYKWIANCLFWDPDGDRSMNHTHTHAWVEQWKKEKIKLNIPQFPRDRRTGKKIRWVEKRVFIGGSFFVELWLSCWSRRPSFPVTEDCLSACCCVHNPHGPSQVTHNIQSTLSTLRLGSGVGGKNLICD